MARLFQKQYLALFLPALLGLSEVAIRGEEIGFVETYALAKDREAVLPQLIPETEDYYYYHVMFYQSTGKVADAEAMLEAWIRKHGETELAQRMKARQMMLTFSTNRERTVEYLKQKLGVNLSHTPPQRDRAAALSTVLDRNLVDYQTVLKQAIETHRELAHVEDGSLVDVIPQLNDTAILRAWLARIRRVDIPALPELILRELKSENSAGFGWAPIHASLTKAQLDELLSSMPNLLENDRFVQVQLQRLKPDGDSSLADRDVMRAYLQRLEDFVSKLPASQRNLRANVLYRRLVFDRQEGVFDRSRLIEYLKYPRNIWYYNPRLLQELQGKGMIDFGADYRGIIPELPPIGDDSELIRHYLEHFFQTDANVDEFAPWIERAYLEAVFAETKILYGIGDSKAMYARLSASSQKEIKERVELKFAATNPVHFDPTQPVKVGVVLKNVPELTIKIYRLNARNVLKQFNGSISTDLDLDGLVANEQRILTYSLPSDRRHAEAIDLPELEGRGLWIIDFLGGGQRSRILIQKGQLRSLQRFSSAGQLLRIIDERGEHVPEAHVELGERIFKPNKDGDILVPYAEKPVTEHVLLVAGNFANHELMLHAAEEYRLEGGFLLEPQGLLSGARAKLVVRPQLICNGQPIALSHLEEVALTLTATDMDGVQTTQVLEKQTLANSSEYVHEFLVPQRLAALTVKLTGRVYNKSRDLRQELSTADSLTVNQLNATSQLGDFYLQKHRDGYVLYALGRNGEAFGRLPIRMQFKVRGVVNPIQVVLATNEKGECDLGLLSDVTNVFAECDFLRQHEFLLTAPQQDWPVRLHEVVGGTIELAVAGAVSQNQFSILEYRGGQVFADYSMNIRLDGGLLTIDKLPAGDFVLLDHASGQLANVAIAGGRVGEGVMQGRARYLEPNLYEAVSIRKAIVEEGKLQLEIGNSDEWTRVHVVATAFDNRNAISAAMRLGRPEPYYLERTWHPSLYVESLKLDEEYQYILGRSKQPKFSGNLLLQPSVLLNPWDLSETDNIRRDAAAGDEIPASAAPAPPMAARPESADRMAKQAGPQSTSYEFLAQGAVLATNLRPDAAGNITLDLGDLDGRTTLQIFVVHPTSVVTHEVLLPRSAKQELADWKLNDQRLVNAFPADSHRAERQSIRRIKGGEWVDLGDARTTRIKTYSKLAEIFSLYEVLLEAKKDQLVKFRSLMQWPELAEEKKRELYDELASHEMHIFLYQKDRAFFDAVVRPYLANKMDKQVVDLYLLGVDISKYAAPWRFDRLNALEKVLVSRAVESKRGAVERYFVDWIGANPVDPVWRAGRFGAGLISNTMEGELEHKLAEKMKETDKLAFGDSTGAALRGGIPGAGPGGMGGGMGGGGMGGLGAANAPGAPPTEAAAAGEADALMEPASEEALAANGSGRAEGGRRGKAARGSARADYFAVGEAEVLARDEAAMRFFQSVQATKKWAESQYYRLAKEQTSATVVPTSPFWLDWLKHSPSNETFLSTNVDLPTTTVHEVLLALAVTDLPFMSPGVEVAVEEGRLRVKAANDSLVFVQSVESIETVADQVALLVGQDIYLGQPAVDATLERPVTRQSLIKGVHYQTRVVVTNPTNQQQRIDVLTQIPQGAIALQGGKTSRNWPVTLAPYSSQQLTYDFYFPQAGAFQHYGAQICNEKGFIVASDSLPLEVLNEPKDIDKTTWAYVADWGTNEDVLSFLKNANVRKLDLQRIAFRMGDKAFFDGCLNLLSDSGVFDSTLWAYALLHRDELRLKEWLEQQEGFVQMIGPTLANGLVSVDPVERKWFEHLDFRPLIVARIHQLGSKKEILNSELAAQYRALLGILAMQTEITGTQKLEIVYYLLLQNRIAEALEWFASIPKQELPTQIQYDYFDAYLSIYRKDYDKANAIANAYLKYPEPRWQKMFGEVASQVKQRQELIALANTNHKNSAAVDPSGAKDDSQRILSDTREKQQSEMARQLPALELQWKDGVLTLQHRNQQEVQVNYYLMDIELLFSRNPFVQQDGKRLSLIEPNETLVVKLEGRSDSLVLSIPESMKNKNLLVEVVGAGIVRSQTVYATSLEILPSESLGRLQVFERGERVPLEGAYVKVYARHNNGEVRFFKDGYTDLRGEFDYASLSTNDLDTAVRFSLLVMHPEYGSLILELNPPKR